MIRAHRPQAGGKYGWRAIDNPDDVLNKFLPIPGNAPASPLDSNLPFRAATP